MMMMVETLTLGTTMGGLAGIGPEIIAKEYRDLRETANPLVIGETGIDEAPV